MRPDGPRDLVAGPVNGPQRPFPIRLQGPIVKGFGRGSKELGIPTANLPIEGLSVGGYDDLQSGVYYGWAGLEIDNDGYDSTSEPCTQNNVYPMVMSLGWNPFYKNKVRSIEVHIIHKFGRDFYGNHLNIAILGFIRPEYDYVSLESLVDDINFDIEVTKRSLARPAYELLQHDPFLLTFASETTL